MNARQKAKYYKRKYEELSFITPMWFKKSSNYTTEVIRAKRTINEELLGSSTIALDIAMADVNDALWEKLKNNIIYKIGKKEISAEIRVAYKCWQGEQNENI